MEITEKINNAHRERKWLSSVKVLDNSYKPFFWLTKQWTYAFHWKDRVRRRPGSYWAPGSAVAAASSVDRHFSVESPLSLKLPHIPGTHTRPTNTLLCFFRRTISYSHRNINGGFHGTVGLRVEQHSIYQPCQRPAIIVVRSNTTSIRSEVPSPRNRNKPFATSTSAPSKRKSMLAGRTSNILGRTGACHYGRALNSVGTIRSQQRVGTLPRASMTPRTVPDNSNTTVDPVDAFILTLNSVNNSGYSNNKV